MHHQIGWRAWGRISRMALIYKVCCMKLVFIISTIFFNSKKLISFPIEHLGAFSEIFTAILWLVIIVFSIVCGLCSFAAFSTFNKVHKCAVFVGSIALLHRGQGTWLGHGGSISFLAATSCLFKRTEAVALVRVLKRTLASLVPWTDPFLRQCSKPSL